MRVISPNYPNEGNETNLQLLQDPPEETPRHAACGCLTRTPPPSPYSIIETPENEEKLKSPEELEKVKLQLLEHYASSAFNVCEHQPLPAMHRPPLKLHIDENVVPFAVNKA